MDREVDYLTFHDVILIARGVLPEVAVRDAGLIESAVARPQTTIFGELAYPTLMLQAAALLHSLARNHPLVDGNKRIAWSSARVFLIMNGVDLDYDIDGAEQLVLGVARGELDVPEIAQTLESWVTH
ncbi:MAG: type II toxin-antitoxin system death-on-curing family toxin [Actinobacteria bacterium]|nr:type II toxin-antitoxin system death-on-curing family toxin [Actinomycetota bacterium]